MLLNVLHITKGIDDDTNSSELFGETMYRSYSSYIL